MRGFFRSVPLARCLLVPVAALLLWAACCTLSARVAAAQMPPLPPMPQAFFGTVEVDGQPAPAGAMVEARGEGVLQSLEHYNPFTVTIAGRYGGPALDEPKLIVQGATLQNGQPLAFFVNDLRAQCAPPDGEWADTCPFSSGEVTPLNLRAGSSIQAEPTPTPTSTLEPTATVTADPTATPTATSQPRTVQNAAPNATHTPRPATVPAAAPTATAVPVGGTEATPAAVDPAPAEVPAEAAGEVSAEPAPVSEAPAEQAASAAEAPAAPAPATPAPAEPVATETPAPTSALLAAIAATRTARPTSPPILAPGSSADGAGAAEPTLAPTPPATQAGGISGPLVASGTAMVLLVAGVAVFAVRARK